MHYSYFLDKKYPWISSIFITCQDRLIICYYINNVVLYMAGYGSHWDAQTFTKYIEMTVNWHQVQSVNQPKYFKTYFI